MKTVLASATANYAAFFIIQINYDTVFTSQIKEAYLHSAYYS